jgi:hypothetical protein
MQYSKIGFATLLAGLMVFSARGELRDAPKASKGKWEGNTFVVDSLGFDDRTWLDHFGGQHSDEMRLQERYHRMDHDTAELTMPLTGPRIYTKPWVSDVKLFELQLGRLRAISRKGSSVVDSSIFEILQDTH